MSIYKCACLVLDRCGLSSHARVVLQECRQFESQAQHGEANTEEQHRAGVDTSDERWETSNSVVWVEAHSNGDYGRSIAEQAKPAVIFAPLHFSNAGGKCRAAWWLDGRTKVDVEPKQQLNRWKYHSDQTKNTIIIVSRSKLRVKKLHEYISDLTSDLDLPVICCKMALIQGNFMI